MLQLQEYYLICYFYDSSYSVCLVYYYIYKLIFNKLLYVTKLETNQRLSNMRFDMTCHLQSDIVERIGCFSVQFNLTLKLRRNSVLFDKSNDNDITNNIMLS